MDAIATLDANDWLGTTKDRHYFLRELREACQSNGFFYLKNHGIPPICYEAVIEQARLFFELPEEEKNAIHIRHSHNFRGFSKMKNERDWREQVHFGWEWSDFLPAHDLGSAYRLAGRNPWPEAGGPIFRSVILEYLAQTHALGCRLLEALAESLELDSDAFLPASEEPPYLLLKLICYYPQTDCADERPGVAPHCDWSWLTILLQDDTGGLEVQLPNGHWVPVLPQAGVLSINVGELLEIVTRGRLRAAPHRVINLSQRQKRLSAPVFINPPLNARIETLPLAPFFLPEVQVPHVHRVKERGSSCTPFLFGDSEWERKGLGKWCFQKECSS